MTQTPPTEWVEIQGFPKYETNKTGLVRSKDKKRIMTMKKGTGKFYLPNEKGEYKLVTPDEVKKSFEAGSVSVPQTTPKVKKEKIQKEKKPKGEGRKLAKIEDYDAHLAQFEDLSAKERSEVKAIVSTEDSNYIKSWKLNKMGYDYGMIAKFMGVRRGNVARDVWMVKKGSRPMPA